jgi:hypothetical protein
LVDLAAHDERRGDGPVKRILNALRRERPVSLIRNGLLVAFAREIGFLRFLWFTRLGRRPVRAYEAPSADTKEVEYSASYLRRYSPDPRVRWPMFLLAAIPDCPKDTLLVIGPRYEPELLMAEGMGWEKAGINGLDTFSYSPWVDVGDMHDLPYGDDSKAAIVCGWTLSYSSRPDVAAREMQRVLRPGGYLVVSMQKIGTEYKDVLPTVLGGSERIQTLGQLDALFSGLVRVAGFEPDVPANAYGHTLAAYRKPGA